MSKLWSGFKRLLGILIWDWFYAPKLNESWENAARKKNEV